MTSLSFFLMIRFYAMNILAELDQPGEWYLDRKTGILYIYPPSQVTPSSEVFVTLLQEPMLSFTEANFLTLSCLNFEYTRGTGVLPNFVVGFDVPTSRFSMLL